MLTLYTREQGMVRAVAKGARKMTSRKAGHLQPYACHYQASPGKTADRHAGGDCKRLPAFAR